MRRSKKYKRFIRSMTKLRRDVFFERQDSLIEGGSAARFPPGLA